MIAEQVTLIRRNVGGGTTATTRPPARPPSMAAHYQVAASISGKAPSPAPVWSADVTNSGQVIPGGTGAAGAHHQRRLHPDRPGTLDVDSAARPPAASTTSSNVSGQATLPAPEHRRDQRLFPDLGQTFTIATSNPLERHVHRPWTEPAVSGPVAFQPTYTGRASCSSPNEQHHDLHLLGESLGLRPVGHVHGNGQGHAPEHRHTHRHRHVLRWLDGARHRDLSGREGNPENDGGRRPDPSDHGGLCRGDSSTSRRAHRRSSRRPSTRMELRRPLPSLRESLRVRPGGDLHRDRESRPRKRDANRPVTFSDGDDDSRKATWRPRGA